MTRSLKAQMKPPRERLADVELFVRVVQAGSFSAAARAIGATPSAVSKGVARLEARLGARLLQRTTRALSPTQQGLVFHERAQRALRELDDAEAALATGAAGVRGTLRVSAPLGLGTHPLVAKTLLTMAKQHPDLHVSLSLTDRHVDLVDERVDVALRVGALPDSSLVVRRLGVVRFAVCGAPAYLRRAGTPRRPADLEHHACLRFLSGGLPVQWVFVDGGRLTPVEVRGPLDADSSDVLRHAAVDGLGLVRTSDALAAEALARGDLVEVLRDFAPPPIPVQALFPSARNLAPAVHAFIETLAVNCRKFLAA